MSSSRSTPAISWAGIVFVHKCLYVLWDCIIRRRAALSLITDRALCPSLLCDAGTVIPSLPSVVKESLSLLFNRAPFQSLDVFVDRASAWWGVSVVTASTGGLALLLGSFSFIMQEAGFPPVTSFTPRYSLAGKLTGNGLPIGIGEFSCVEELQLHACVSLLGPRQGAKLPLACPTCQELSLLFPCNRYRLHYGFGQQNQVVVLL